MEFSAVAIVSAHGLKIDLSMANSVGTRFFSMYKDEVGDRSIADLVGT